MKKVIFTLVAAAFLSSSFMSCSKCGHCVVNGVSSAKYCEKDGKDEYQAAQDACDYVGGTWRNN